MAKPLKKSTPSSSAMNFHSPCCVLVVSPYFSTFVPWTTSNQAFPNIRKKKKHLPKRWPIIADPSMRSYALNKPLWLEAGHHFVEGEIPMPSPGPSPGWTVGPCRPPPSRREGHRCSARCCCGKSSNWGKTETWRGFRYQMDLDIELEQDWHSNGIMDSNCPGNDMVEGL